ADELRAEEFLGGSAVPAEGGGDFLDAFADRPLRLVGGQALSDLVAVDAVVAHVRARVARVGHFGGGDRFGHHLRDFTYAVVFRGHADVEGLVVHQLPGRLENRDERT